MSIETPSDDFTNILNEIGQPITIRSITRTINNNGMVTGTTTTDTNTTAVVQEVSYKEKVFLQMGLVNVGDIMYFVSPSTNINIYDLIIWNSTTFKIRKILIPPRINGTILFKQILSVQDSGNFPT